MFHHSREETGTDMGILYLGKTIHRQWMVREGTSWESQIHTRDPIPLLRLHRSVLLDEWIGAGSEFHFTLFKT